MDTAQWPQEIVTNTSPKPTPGNELARKGRTHKEQAQNCPRCNSTNTKFCYYNNYSLTQPRFFCKACRRYWTKGGSLRSIPVGGGSRKNKRSSTSSLNSNSSSSSSSKKLSLDDHHQNSRNPDGQDLNLAFPSSSSSQPLRSFAEIIQNQISPPSASTSSPSHQLSALELLTGFSSRGLGAGFMPMPVHHHDPNTGYGQGLGFPLHDFKPTLSFSLDGFGSGYESLQESGNGRPLFPFADIKQQQQQVSRTGDDEPHKESNNNGDSTGYWTGMLGGGGSW